jgi:SagB-type dehydrogenase family enzyme
MRRRTHYSFSGGGLDISTLARLLRIGDGVVGSVTDSSGFEWQRRTAPSGGALYPIEMFLMVLTVEGLAAGIYHYDSPRHILSLVSSEAPLNVIQASTALGDLARGASCCIALVAVLPRIKVKYGERGYRFALLEAGHIAQNLLLGAEMLDLNAIPLGGYLDDHINDALRLDGCDEVAIYLLLVGRRPSEKVPS